MNNHGQIVSTGNVNIRQAAGGYQYFNTSTGQWTAIQTVGNDLQVVSTGSVNVDQSAAGQQTLQTFSGNGGGGGGSSTCTPGDYYQDGMCAVWCSMDCEWLQHCCDDKKGKCCGR